MVRYLARERRQFRQQDNEESSLGCLRLPGVCVCERGRERIKKTSQRYVRVAVELLLGYTLVAAEYPAS